MTKIEWCHAPGFKAETWNPLVGCSLASPGCTNCYAMGAAWRMSHNPGTPQYHGTAEKVNGKPVWTGKVNFVAHKLREPLLWKTPSFVFVNSMSDLFHEDVPDAWIDRVFAVMALCRHHVFIVLTKRPERMRAYMKAREVGPGDRPALLGFAKAMFAVAEAAGRRAPGMVEWPLPNVILGTSIESQEYAYRALELIETPAWLRVVSIEPQLGLVDMTGICNGHHFTDVLHGRRYHDAPEGQHGASEACPSIDWVLSGFENGDRPGRAEWAVSLARQCEAAGVPLYHKQNGSFLEGRELERGQFYFIDQTRFVVNDERSNLIATEAREARGGARCIEHQWWASGDGRLLKHFTNKSLSGAALPLGPGGLPQVVQQFPRAVIDRGLANYPDTEEHA